MVPDVPSTVSGISSNGNIRKRMRLFIKIIDFLVIIFIYYID